VPPVVVAQLQHLRPGVGVRVRVRFRDYAVWLLPDGSARVLDNYCSHIGGPLSDGPLEDGCVICPWHGWAFDLSSGRRRMVFGDFPGVRAYRAWVQDGQVWAELPDSSLS